MIKQTGTELLVGKTITSAIILGCKNFAGWVENKTPCDGENVLKLTFSDGTSVEITGGYGGYTGKSCDEYFEKIDIEAIN